MLVKKGNAEKQQEAVHKTDGLCSLSNPYQLVLSSQNFSRVRIPTAWRGPVPKFVCLFGFFFGGGHLVRMGLVRAVFPLFIKCELNIY